MPITDKSRKILWGKSGSRCAICKHSLVMSQSESGDEEAIVGDECHIIASEVGGPRGEDPSRSDIEIDHHENLILLCKIHHKQVDDQYREFTVEKLRDLKLRHEKWVTSRLDPRARKRDPITLRTIKTGADLFSFIQDSHAHVSSNADLNTEEEADLVGSFLQDMQDYGDIYNDLEPSQRVKSAFEMNATLARLSEFGFTVHAGKGMRTFNIGPEKTDWQIFVVHVARSDDKRIFVYQG